MVKRGTENNESIEQQKKERKGGKKLSIEDKKLSGPDRPST